MGRLVAVRQFDRWRLTTVAECCRHAIEPPLDVVVSPLAELWRHRLVALHEDDACSYGPPEHLHSQPRSTRGVTKTHRLREHRKLRRKLSERLHLERPARFGCLHRMRALHRRLSGQRGRQRTLAARYHSSTTELE